MSKIANHTTQVPVARTVGEITEILVAHGARSVNIEYDQMNAKAVRFEITRPEFHMAFELPVDVNATHAALNEARTHRMKAIDMDQARRVAWRVVRDWLRAQLALIEIGAAKIEQVMLPYAITADGTTVYQRMLATRFSSLQALPPAGGAA